MVWTANWPTDNPIILCRFHFSFRVTIVVLAVFTVVKIIRNVPISVVFVIAIVRIVAASGLSLLSTFSSSSDLLQSTTILPSSAFSVLSKLLSWWWFTFSLSSNLWPWSWFSSQKTWSPTTTYSFFWNQKINLCHFWHIHSPCLLYYRYQSNLDSTKRAKCSHAHWMLHLESDCRCLCFSEVEFLGLDTTPGGVSSMLSFSFALCTILRLLLTRGAMLCK